MTCVKICVTGPESTGKSTLARTLAQHLKASLVDEKVREYLNTLKRKHTFSDLEKIARLQFKAIKDGCIKSKLLILDTDLLTFNIWAEDKYKMTISYVDNLLLSEKADLYLLCYPDLPWEDDPLREDRHRLVEIYEKYVQQLNSLGYTYYIIKGIGEERFDEALKICKNFVDDKKLE